MQKFCLCGIDEPTCDPVIAADSCSHLLDLQPNRLSSALLVLTQ